MSACIAVSKSTQKQCGNDGDVSLVHAAGGLCKFHFGQLEDRGELLTVEGVKRWPAEGEAGGTPPETEAEAEPDAADSADIPEFDPVESEPAATPPPPAKAWDVPDVPQAEEPSPAVLDDDPADPFDGAELRSELGSARAEIHAAPLPSGAWSSTARLGWQIVGARLERAGASALEGDELDALAEAWGSALAYQFRNIDPNNPWGAAMMTAGMVLLPRVLEIRSARARPQPKPAAAEADAEVPGRPGPPPPPSSIMSQLV
ncbi:MAG TPA: hypothetical protein VFL93_07155 [Longimicrobiaceae bacterium]|nr:hypothetical protein [Longimicrobiaceae bacterium]